ncbi:CE1759 family FMN reductase [Conexibacter sp. SYSU D00693]|uniref:CE1759 family FMN reductase n=1 Tax=Conexibacter sp. SYSU D00693 TaxID=2812560 RepID=UPI00196AC8E0|nr:CE1759 family FMN reductase [Conexibacter sp. SYSU D00693]
MSEPVRVVVLSAGTSDPSTTRLLADRVASKVVEVLGRDGRQATVATVELAPLATDAAAALVGGPHSAALDEAVGLLAGADVVVASTPVYKAGVSGLFKTFADVLDDDLLVGTTVVLAATAGSARHAMVVDDHLRPLFAFLRAVAVPTSVFAAPEDWSDAALGRRVERAAVEAAALAGVERTIAGGAWGHYQHQFDSRAQRPDGVETSVDFDTPLMRLAAGGPAERPDGREG